MTKDALDTDCTCPDIVVHTRTRLRKPYQPLRTTFICLCCGNPIDTSSDYFNRSTA